MEKEQSVEQQKIDHNGNLTQNEIVSDPIPADVIEILDELPKEKQQIILRSVLSIKRRELYSGPLPPSEDFANYERTLPGAANRILEMAEKQLNHRIGNENKIIDNTIIQTNRGQWIGAVLAAFGLAIALVLGLYGHDILAGSIGVTTVIYLAVLFVTNQEPKELKHVNKTQQDQS